MKKAVIFAVLTLGACQSKSQVSVAIAPCPIDKAVYSQAGSKEVTAGFALQRERSRYASDLVFFVKRGTKSYWFGFEMPNGYGGPYLYPQIDPKLVKPAKEGETPDDSPPGSKPAEDAGTGMNFDAFDAKMVNLDRVPQADDPAPAFLFSAQLGPHFWYGANGGPYANDPAVEISRQLWQQTGCDKDAH